MNEKTPPSRPIDSLLTVMARLRNPDGGCPWDLEQSFETIAPCTIEEAYEVADAIQKKDMEGLREELGDLLLQVVFHSQMASEQGLFTFEDVAQGIVDKLIFRHPHVFGEETASSAGAVVEIWEERKKAEKAAKEAKNPAKSILDDIPVGFPALMRAQKISKKAAKVGFEWQNIENVLDKVQEEIEELRQAIKNKSKAEMEDELGDLFFVLVNLGRWMDIDCEDTVRKTNNKFYRRFSGMEADIKLRNEDMGALTPDEWEAYWQVQKAKERKKAG
jgi:ATP diphosphatase